MNLSDRKFIIVIIFITVGIIFALRLFFLQVIDDEWKVMAANASERVITEYPARGLIYDRNGELMVANTAVYDLMVIPRDMKNIDTLAFCALLEIDTAEFNAKINAARKYSRYKPTAFAKQIPAALYVDIAENL